MSTPEDPRLDLPMTQESWGGRSVQRFGYWIFAQTTACRPVEALGYFRHGEDHADLETSAAASVDGLLDGPPLGPAAASVIVTMARTGARSGRTHRCRVDRLLQVGLRPQPKRKELPTNPGRQLLK